MTPEAAQAPGLPEAAAEGGPRLEERQWCAWMVRYQQGDGEAAEKLIRDLSPLLWRYFVSPFTSPADAEDLLQNCWLRIHRSRHTYRAGEPLLPWIFAIARHTRLDAYRRRRRRQSKETLVAELPETAAHAAPPESRMMARLLDRLPESQREVLLMLKVSGMSLEEVARATSTTVGAIKQKAHRGYARLREMIRREGL